MKEEKHFKLLWGGVLTMVKCCLDIVIEMKGDSWYDSDNPLM
jgi:hypothetical protein